MLLDSVAGISLPVEIEIGEGAAECLARHAEPPLLVFGTPRALRDRRWPAAHRFTELAPNPSPAAIRRAHAAARAARPRTIVGIGGGSTLDLAKIVAAFADHASVDLAAPPPGLRRVVRLIQIPTTAGTGAEVTRWASYWLDGGAKASFDHAAGWADVAIVDPRLTAAMRPRLTAATGLDALAHAVEALWGRHHGPSSDALALAALGRIRDHLAVAVAAPDPRARAAMSEAALLAGAALAHTRSAAAHALSYDLTGRFGVEHGLAVGLLCGALMPEVARRAPDRAALVAGALGLADPSELAGFVGGVVARAGLAPSLAALGVPPAALPELAAAALGNERLANQPGEWTAADALAALTRIA